MHNDFRVAFGSKRMAIGKKLFANRLVIIDFTVKRNPYAFIFIAEWLMAGRPIDDAQSAMTQADRAIHPNALIVRTSMDHRADHPLQCHPLDRALILANYPCYATHACVSSNLKEPALLLERVQQWDSVSIPTPSLPRLPLQVAASRAIPPIHRRRFRQSWQREA